MDYDVQIEETRQHAEAEELAELREEMAREEAELIEIGLQQIEDMADYDDEMERLRAEQEKYDLPF